MYVDRSLSLELQGHDDDSLDGLQAALNLRNEQPERVYAHHCYLAAVAGMLGMAELTCSQAIEKETMTTARLTAWALCICG